MRFSYDPAVGASHPTLVTGVLAAEAVTADAPTNTAVAAFATRALRRLQSGPESGFAEIQAWRRAFAAMGLKPTQYRCASESLLRRLRKDGTLPRLHPLVDLCNAVSAAYAVPVAALDRDRITGNLQVRPAGGTEDYETFGGEHEHPAAGEVVFVDDAGHAHARRWTNRQSGLSAVDKSTSRAFVVVEGLHDAAGDDVASLVDELAAAVRTTWDTDVRTAVLTTGRGVFDAG